MEPIVNKVAESGIITLDLAEHMPSPENLLCFDLKPYLFREMILKEKDYRAALQTTDWQLYAGKHVYVTCSADAIIPMWAYMLAAVFLQPVAATVYFGTEQELQKQLLLQNISAIDLTHYNDKRVVVKGCGDTHIPEYAYVAISALLLPVVKSLMYGEPCSTVPLYKARKPV
jgi:hypothetical protein